MSEQLLPDPLPDSRQPRLRLAQDGTRGERPYVPQGNVTEPRAVHLLDYVKVLYKRRWTAITAFLLVAVSVTVYTFTAIPIYDAKVRLLVQAEDQNVVEFKKVVEEGQSRADYYQTQYNMLQSRALARRTIDQLQLWEGPPFAGKSEAGFSLKRSVAALPGAIIGLFRTADREPAVDPIPGADETAAQSRVIDAFVGNLTVAPVRNSRLVDLRYSLPDPAMATTIANALAKNYIEQNLEFKFLASKEASDWLGQRLAEQRQLVEVAEAKLQQYREQNDAISFEDRQNITVQKLGDLNAAVTRAKTVRIEKEAVYNQLRESQSNPALLDTFPAILSNGYIQQQKVELAALTSQHAQLSERLGEKHPQITALQISIKTAQNKLQGEIGKIVQSVRSDYLAAVAQEQSLVSALNQQKSEALAMNRKAIDYGVLERDAQSSKQLYQNLMQRAKETGVTGELKTSNIRVVDPAELPRSPTSPKKQLNMLVGLFGGLLFGTTLVFFFEYLDSRIKTPDEIRLHLGLAHLGLLPALDPKGGYPLINNGVPALFSEAFRAARTNVLFSSAQEGARSLVVTSTGPGEGKSMVAANLAISLAQAGQRVLLIDGDMRKPKVHEIFGFPQEPGLSNVLVGNAKASDAVKKSPVSGLWLLSSGMNPPNPAELLGSKRCREFVMSLEGHFDWIIIDSPPVMAVTDAALVAHYASGVVFVVGCEMTSRHAAKRALDQLEQAQAKFVGAILNRVDLEHNAYYYSQYYRREYSQYYATKT